jgi:CelD/BcsL family acetyltransferase involved in cellulose biosynthesis
MASRQSPPGDAQPATAVPEHAAAVRLLELDLPAYERLAEPWDRLAVLADSPYLSSAWLAAWWRAFGDEHDCVALTLVDEHEALLAGGVFVRTGGGRLRAATNAESSDWDVVAVDERARRLFWQQLAELGCRRLELPRFRSATAAAQQTRDALTASGFKLAESNDLASPKLELPASFDDLLAARSKQLRAQVRRLRRALDREGEVVLRTTTEPGEQFERDLDSFLTLEASGWKTEAGTAIRSQPTWEVLYRGFAAAASADGWMRLYVLELDGRPIAADYGCAFAGCGYLIKTGFDEQLRELSPGIVLRAEVIKASIEEGLTHYDFLGRPDRYKTRWTSDLRQHTVLRAFRGPRTLPASLWWRHARPSLKGARDRARALRRSDD